jgi:methylase of polypeptide subunit release factors
MSVLDLGTASGALLLSIMAEESLRGRVFGMGIDLNEKALTSAITNAEAILSENKSG